MREWNSADNYLFFQLLEGLQDSLMGLGISGLLRMFVSFSCSFLLVVPAWPGEQAARVAPCTADCVLSVPYRVNASSFIFSPVSFYLSRSGRMAPSFPKIGAL